jgi:hypothetical protein
MGDVAAVCPDKTASMQRGRTIGPNQAEPHATSILSNTRRARPVSYRISRSSCFSNRELRSHAATGPTVLYGD